MWNKIQQFQVFAAISKQNEPINVLETCEQVMILIYKKEAIFIYLCALQAIAQYR